MSAHSGAPAARPIRRGLALVVATFTALSLTVSQPAWASAPTPAGNEISAAATTIGMTASAAKIVHGESVVIRYVLTGAGGPIPSAPTVIRYGGRAIPAVVDAAGRGAINIRDLPVGVPAVIVRFAGDAAHAAATATVTVTVTPRVSAIASLAASPSIVTAGKSVAVRFLVTSAGKPLPSARVALTYRGTTVWARSGADGRVAQTVAGLPVGQTSVLVRYFGDTIRTRVSATTVVTVTSPCPATARACINLTDGVTWIQDAGKVVYGPVPITSGRPGYRTRPGTFKVYWKDKDHRSSVFNGAPMPNSIFFDGGNAFHQGSLAVPSHGCIHLSWAASREYWARLTTGDTVFVWGAARY